MEKSSRHATGSKHDDNISAGSRRKSSSSSSAVAQTSSSVSSTSAPKKRKSHHHRRRRGEENGSTVGTAVLTGAGDRALVQYSDVSSEDLSGPEAGEIQSGEEESGPVLPFFHAGGFVDEEEEEMMRRYHAGRPLLPEEEEYYLRQRLLLPLSPSRVPSRSGSISSTETKQRRKKEKKHKRDKRSKKKKKKSRRHSKSTSEDGVEKEESLSDWEPQVTVQMDRRVVHMEKVDTGACSPVSNDSHIASPEPEERTEARRESPHTPPLLPSKGSPHGCVRILFLLITPY